MHTMAGILANFIIEFHSFVTENEDDFNWESFNTYPLDSVGNRLNWHYYCNDINEALEKKNKLFEKYTKVLICNNEIREETVHEKN